MPRRTDYTVSLYRRKGSPCWWARMYLAGGGGSDKRWSTGVAVEGRESKRLAQGAAEDEADRIAKAARDESGGPESDASLSAVGRRMLAHKIADGGRDRAVSTLSWQLDKHVLPFFGLHRDVRTIRRADVESFKGHLRTKGYKAQTINNLLTATRQLLKHACKVDELIESAPEVANVPVDPDHKWHLLSKAEIKKLIDSLDPRAVEAKHFLIFLANTGLRKSEALAIRWSWVDWKGEQINIPAAFTKGGIGRLPVNLNGASTKVLRERQKLHKQRANPDDDRVFRQLKHDRARNSAAKKAELGRVRNHDLRHSFASLAHASGASLIEVADMLGHTTLEMVRRYGHSFDDRLKTIAKAVEVGGEAAAPNVPGSVPGGASRSGTNRRNSARRGLGPRRKIQ